MRAALKQLSEAFPEEFPAWVLIGGSACWFYREALRTSEGFDWLIYASHESSITVAGEWLLDSVKSIWPNWKDNPWSLHLS